MAEEQDKEKVEEELVEIENEEQYNGVVQKWILARREAKRYGNDFKIKEIDKKYQEMVKKYMIKVGKDNMDVVNPPLKIPQSVFSQFKKGE